MASAGNSAGSGGSGSNAAACDPRITPARGDIAAAALKGRVRAEKFVHGTEMQVAAPVADLRGTDDASAFKGRQESQLLMGEVFTVYEEKDGLCWGQCATDGYVGYVPRRSLAASAHTVTHRVTAPFTHAYPEPDIKTVPVMALPMLAGFRPSGEKHKGWMQMHTGQWVFERHIAPVASLLPDFTATAEKFLGVPYLWAGRTAFGIDCSGLVQTALLMAGVACPRDTDLQEAALGAAVPMDAPLHRGDLVFFKGHVGIMLDHTLLLHANAFHMAVTKEPLAAVLRRQEENKQAGITAVRRL